MFHETLKQKYGSKITFEDVFVCFCSSAGSAWIESWIAFGYLVGSSGGAHKKIPEQNRYLLTGPQTRWNAVLARLWIQFPKLENKEMNARENYFINFDSFSSIYLSIVLFTVPSTRCYKQIINFTEKGMSLENKPITQDFTKAHMSEDVFCHMELFSYYRVVKGKSVLRMRYQQWFAWLLT